MKFFIIALVILGIFWLPDTIQKYKLQGSNNLVTVTVEKIPICNMGYKRNYITVNYKGSTHILRTRCKFVSHLSEGDEFEILHKEGTDIFLFKEENITWELIAYFGVLLAAILYILFRSKRKK